MRFEPKIYQVDAIRRVTEQNAVGLFLEMGLGKTVVTLSAIDELMFNRFEVNRVLVIAPLRVAEDTWVREASKWDHLKHLRISRVLGSAKNRAQALAAGADVYVINRENVDWLVDYLGDGWMFDMVVIDELSSFKNKSSKRFKALKKVRGWVKRIVGLTGTPAPNGLLDLWSQVWLLDQGAALGRSFTAYRDAYFQPDKRSRTQVFSYKPRAEAEQEIYERLEGLCVSMKAVDWLQMPERIDNIVPVRLSDQARAAYDQLERDYLLPVAGTDIEAKTAASLANKLLQLAGGAAYDDTGGWTKIHDDKLEVMAELVEAAQGKPMLVFYAYQHELERLQAAYPQGVVLRDTQTIADWNAGRIGMLLAHPASAGHGLNLQDGGSTIVWYGLTWSLELYQQANARLHRQGQQQSVIVHHLVAEDTIDQEVLGALSGKAKGQEALFRAVKARIERVRCNDADTVGAVEGAAGA